MLIDCSPQCHIVCVYVYKRVCQCHCAVKEMTGNGDDWLFVEFKIDFQSFLLLAFNL